MKKIRKDEVKKIAKLLKEIEYSPVTSDYSVFFPIETDRHEDFDGLEMCIKNTGVASKKPHVPGLILAPKTTESIVHLAYANTDYSANFDVIQYIELLSKKPSKALREFLLEHEALLVSKEYIPVVFKI